jgi:hypothetical protein
VLEILGAAGTTKSTKSTNDADAGQEDMLAQLLAVLPPVLREPLQRGDMATFQQELEQLPADAQQAVLAALQPLMQQMQGGGGDGGGGGGGGEVAEILERFEPLLQAIAAVAGGDDGPRSSVEQALAQLEQRGFVLTNAVQRIWQGERDVDALTAGLDAVDSALVARVLEIMERGEWGMEHGPGS